MLFHTILYHSPAWLVRWEPPPPPPPIMDFLSKSLTVEGNPF